MKHIVCYELNDLNMDRRFMLLALLSGLDARQNANLCLILLQDKVCHLSFIVILRSSVKMFF